MAAPPKKVSRRLADKLGLRLDLGCGIHKTKGFVGVDRVHGKQVDVVHDLLRFPWPFPTNSANTIVMAYLWQEIPRSHIRKFMDELYRVAQPDCEVFISGHFGLGVRSVGDPRVVNYLHHATLYYWDPSSDLYKAFKPHAKFALKAFKVVPVGPDKDFNAVIQAIKKPVRHS